MDDSLKLMEGGKDGVVIHAGDAANSDLVNRILLPVDVDDHMPPREKGQLSENQISLLEWWIATGADFTKKVKDLDQSGKMKSVLMSFQQQAPAGDTLSFVPKEPVAKGDERIFDSLVRHGIMVQPLGKNSNYLSVNFYTDTLVSDDDMDLLLSLKEQVTWLKIGFTDLDDARMDKLAQLTNLTKLSMEHTRVTDNGLEKLRSCARLQYLNVVGTAATANGILALKDLKELRSIYLYQTKVGKPDWPALRAAFPAAYIDTGGYQVATLVTDTTVVGK